METAAAQTLSRRDSLLRLLPFAAGFVLLAGIVSLIGFRVLPSRQAHRDAPISKHSAQVVAPLGPRVPLSKEQKALIPRFVHDAVMRKDLASAWTMVTSKVRFQTTQREWMTGNIRVVPYPDGAIAPGLKVDYSTAKEAKVELALFAKKPNAAFPTVFDLYFSKIHGHWLVDGWTPHGISGVRKV